MPRKILIDSRFYGLENKGIGRYTCELLSCLQHLDSKNEYYILLRRKYFNKLNYKGNFNKILADFRYYTLTEQFKLPFILNKLNPDIFHALNTNVPLFYSGNLVVTVHDTMQLVFNKKSTTLPLAFYAIKSFAYRNIFRKSLERSKAIISPSNFVKADIIDKFDVDPNKIFVIPEGVSSVFRKNRTRNRRTGNYFVYVGSSYPHKNLEVVVRALKKINLEGFGNVGLRLVLGRDVFANKHKNLVKETGIQKNVEFLADINDGELRKIYSSSLGFVFPSMFEGFGLPGLEAMAAGTLVACSDIPTFREVYGENAIYFDPKNSESVVGSMLKILNISSAERAKRIKKSQEYVKQFNWCETAKKTLEIYNSIV
ncbi:hypothetical protein A2961_02725 [Candidatus Woesebacteria bacterium RIFCSPLOWO2_01_FULL_39_21]|uniref:Glycosyl transferase family 1 domain-containing protein n=1 Tax=Candidatus Woesebacteria bacterium RIFCSPLOWO2_01_FULL_39_21 TaxID=1802519 RepID=A0A1F8BD23_9BACT|nr:MAG: hypothetical protein A2691_04560 [Candidatus Woesebacteria bacterium RIFCSPHIGHO2_01_FULL_39_23]OGM61954.1 MAG: hypothetical protein A2961_02725 [Candidatus Woesebacteria bacterium RIFCSPLOWO2_01_FULL_39_21]